MFENVLSDRCPKCGGAIGYHINSYGQIVKQCNTCKYIIVNNTVATNKTIKHVILTLYIQLIASTYRKHLEIKCDSIILKQNDISICFCSEKDIKQFDSITINGIKFKKVEEE